MSVNPFQPKPFFQDKSRAFWNLQLAGWAGAFILRGISGLANGQPISFLIPVLISTSHGLFPDAAHGGDLPLAAAPAPAHHLGSVDPRRDRRGGDRRVHRRMGIHDAEPGGGLASLQLLLGAYYLTVTLLFAWSALYYAINFYLTVEEQADQLQRLEGQASAAQLAMLRYQLNPHFLFNTLNSISTLVLLKQTERANAMLSRLSSFLRYTLINEPTAHGAARARRSRR
jgi:hypothetical protein